MNSHRLGRLAKLTQGVALVGLGLADMACGKDAASPDDNKPHINSPPHTNATADPTPTASASAPLAEPPKDLPTMNSPPTPPPSASASAPPAAASSGPKIPPPKMPIRTNSTK